MKHGVEVNKEYVKKNWDNATPNIEYFTELQRVSKNQIILVILLFRYVKTNRFVDYMG